MEKNGKQVPEKVGMKGITREGMDYEFTLVLELDIRHSAKASKDRTGLFSGKPDFQIRAETGKQILQWCNVGTSQQQIEQMIRQAQDVPTLINLYATYPEFRQPLAVLFTQRKEQLQVISQPQSPNGQSHGNTTHASR